MKSKALFTTSVITLLLSFAFDTSAATYYAVANGFWNASATWATSSGGVAGVGVPATGPVAGDDAVIERGNTVTIRAGAACTNLQLGGLSANNAGTLTFNGAFTLAVSGAVRVGGGGNANRDGVITFFNGSTITAGSVVLGGTVATPAQGTIDMAAGGTLSVSGGITIGAGLGTWTPGTATGTVNLTGTSTLPATIFTTFNNITLTAGTTTLGTGIAVTGNFTNNGGTLTQGANTITFNGGGAQAINGTAVTQTFNDIIVNKAGASTLTVSGSTTTLNVANLTETLGNFTAPATLTATGTIILTAGTYTAGTNTSVGGDFTNNGGTFTHGGNTVTFNGSAAQAINGSAATQTFGNIIVNKGSSSTLSVSGSTTTLNVTNLTETLGNFTAPATLAATGTITLTAGTYTAGAATSVGVDFTNNGGTFTPGANTVTFNGAGAQAINGTAATQTFNNIIINKGGGTLTVSGSTTTLNVAALTETLGNFTAPATLTASGTITLTAGTYTAGTNTNVAGNWTNNGGTFTPGSNTVTFNGSGAQAINGSAVTQTFNNIVVNKGSSSTLTVSGSTTTLNLANLTETLGNFTAPATLAASGTITITAGTYTAGANTNITGDFVNNGTFTSGANRVTFTGAGAKAISGTTSTSFQNLRMSTTGSAVLNINKSTTINGTLDWTAAGILVLSSTSDLTLASTAVITGPSTTQYIQLDGTTGTNSQVIRVSDGTAAKWQFLFPIGTATGGYTPLDMSTATVSAGQLPTASSTLAVKAILKNDIAGRMKRTFRMIVAGNSNSATTFTGAQFSYSAANDVSTVSGDTQATYTTIWYRKESTSTWTTVTGTAPGVTFFTGPSVGQSLANDTYYFTIGSATAYSAGTVWYSYQSGNWTDPLSWTTDGSLFPLYVNPGSATPAVADDVIITSGRTITMNVSNKTIASLTVTGTLDLLASTGHDFYDISGTGRIKMSATTDNFPIGTYTNFADPDVGGTIEINGTGMSLNQTRTFNNMVINMTGTSDIATLFNTITLNGDLTVTNGLFRFNDNATSTSRTIRVNGDVTVATTGGIRTGSANARHEFNLYGDFTNNGTAYFTNRVAANMSAEATDGIVDVNFLSASQDQQASCNGVTRFYRIEITKGTDDTYKASFAATDPTYFNLFGAANYDINEANAASNSNGTNLNALGLNSGTVELGTNITVVLNTVSNYAIYEGARLWINGATVSKTGGTAVVPYGTLRVSAGSLTVDLNSGLTLRVNGVILVEGGTVTVRAIRTSTAGAGAVGSYIQSGGNVYVTGGTISTDYAAFSLTYTGNVFNMSGGTLTIQNRVDLGTSNLRGAIFINSDPANISVTGGTVVMETNTNVSYRVTSRASFWNVIMRKTAGSNSTIELFDTTSGTGTVGVDELSLVAQPLVVLNDFTVEGSTAVTFLTNDENVTVSGNFQVQTGATYTPGTNTTTITGSGVSSMTLGTGATQTFNNLTINKSSSSGEVVIIAGNATALRTTGTLTVSVGIFDYGSFIVSARGTVTLGSGVIVGKTASTGKLLLDGTVDQTLNSTSAFIYNLELNNTDASPVITLSTGDLTIYKTLTMTAGLFNINIYKLTLSGSAANISGASFSSTKMIQTSGNASDGGLEMYVDANEVINYPIGVSGKYTPAVAQFASFSDDGLVAISPVSGALPTASAGADLLTFYWKATHSNFTVLPKVSYQFTYVTADVVGTEANYLPGKVLNASPYTRSTDGATDDVVDASNLIVFNGVTTAATFPGAGFTLEAANYTAGAAGRFAGTVNIYYSRVTSGSWETPASWSLNAANGSGTQQVPTAGSVVVIQTRTANSGDRINVGDATGSTVATVAGVQFNFTGSTITSETVPRLQFWNNQTHNIGVVSGTGMVSFNGPNAPTVNGDFGDFGSNTDSYFLYWGSGGSHTLTAIPSPIPNLMLESATFTINQTITVNGNLISQGNAVTIPNQNIRALGNLYVGVWQGGTFQFPGTGSALTVTIDGDVDFTQDPFAAPGNRNLIVNNPGSASTTEHTLVVKGDIIQGSSNNNVIDLFNAANRPWVALEFQGTGTNTYTRSSTSQPDLYRITCNKGTDITSTFSLNNPVTLNAVTNVAQKAITLTNGLLIINNTGTYTLSSGGGNFDIPSTAGLQVTAGTVNMTTASTGMTLSGLLRVNGGTATLDAGAGLDNFIEYSNTGTATLEVTSGALTVGSQIRRSLVANTGVLMYTQSGGTVIVGNRSATSSTRGVFEILNTGSQFNHTGGSLTIVRGNGSSSVPSLWLEPASSSLSGSTITIGNASTPTGTIGIQSSATLNNLTIAGLAASTPTAKLYVLPLSLTGNITVSASNTLDAQGLDINVGGNFAIDGTYTPGVNTTTFTNTGAAAISGTTPTLSFYNFAKTAAGTLTLSKDITINRDLQASAGTLATATFAINLKRHAEVDATITSTSGSGLIFNGTAQQQLSRSVSGTGAFGIVTVNNSNGVIIPDGNGYDFSVSNNLRLQSGVFDIGGSLLSLGSAAVITPVSAFSVTNMIQTNSSFTDKGLKKQFPTNYTTNFTFPVGQLNYTPVIFDFATAGNTTGTTGTPTITVRPANERHPAVINDNQVGELPDPATFNDLNNVLQYYWIINADNVASTFKSSMTLQYVQSMVSVVAPYTEADYLSARILSDANPTILINKFNTTDVNETTNVITYSFASVTDAGISGDYFAGVDLAIPSNVPIYTTTSSGNVDAAIYTPAVIGGGAPAGALVIVQTGHTLTFNANNISLYETQINAGGKLVIPSGSIGHRLGDVSGTGDLEIDSNTGSAVLPAAIYDVFFSCAGGGLIYGGSGTYDILGSITTLRNLTLEGAGVKTLANNDITICNDFTLNGGTFSNLNSRTVTVQNDVLLNASTLNNLAGTLTITRDLIQTAGSFDGGTAGTKTIGRNLTVSGGTFTPGSGSANIIRVNGNMTVAGGATIVAGTGGVTGQRFTFGGSSAQTLTGTFTSTRAFNRLEISNSSGLTLAGNTTINSELLLTSGYITPGSSTFLLESNAVSNPTDGKSTSFVNGKLNKVLANGQSFTFPIGRSARWRSGEVNSVSQSGSVTWSMEFFLGDPTGVVALAPAPRSTAINNFTPADPAILRMGGDGYWRVYDGSSTSNGRTAKVGLSWGIESDVSPNLAQREALTVMSWSGTNWINNGGTNFQPGGAHTQSRGSFLSTSTLSFSENIVMLGSTEVANPLPISLAWFKGEIVGGQGYLYWRTESELNNDHFEIQRSNSSGEFAVIGKVQGKGTTNAITDYGFEDNDLQIGKNYYRLKQVDLDGKVSYSKTIVLDFDGIAHLGLRVFPNPTSRSNINFKVLSSKTDGTIVRMFDMTGKIVYKSEVNADEIGEELLIEAGDSLKGGMYVLEVIQGKSRATQRIILRD